MIKCHRIGSVSFQLTDASFHLKINTFITRLAFIIRKTQTVLLDRADSKTSPCSDAEFQRRNKVGINIWNTWATFANS